MKSQLTGNEAGQTVMLEQLERRDSKQTDDGLDSWTLWHLDTGHWTLGHRRQLTGTMMNDDGMKRDFADGSAEPTNTIGREEKGNSRTI